MPHENIVAVFDATLLDSNECHLHSYDFQHSSNVIFVFLDTQRNSFSKNLGTFKVDYFSTPATY